MLDVLIVGAGPTGLMLAAELERYGLSYRLIDKGEGPCTHSRALAIQPRTLEILDMIGIAPSFIEKGLKISTIEQLSSGKKIAEVNFSKLDTAFPYILSLPQSETEKLLIAHLESLKGKVERGVELIAIEKERMTLLNGEVIKAKYIVGCDGAHSFLRKHLGLGFLGKTLSEVFSLADVEIQWPFNHGTAHTFLHPKGILAVIPLPSPNSYRLIFQLPRCQKKESKIGNDNLSVAVEPPTMEEVIHVVHERATKEAKISRPLWLANFHVNSRLTTHYCNGNIFLAGDAAHIHSPIGGQGMNTGLQDAFALAWRLALTVQGKLSPKALTSYEEERHAVAKRLLQGTFLATKMAALRSPLLIRVRNFILPKIMHFSKLQKKLLRNLTQLAICYPKSDTIQESGHFLSGAKVGERMPNIDNLLKKAKTFTLLLSGIEKGLIEKALQRQRVPIQVHALQKAPWQAKVPSCYLVRPDGIVCYRQAPFNKEALLSYLASWS